MSRRPTPSVQDIQDWQARLRTALFEAVSEDDVREIAEGLVAKAKAGDLSATRMLFNFVMGGSGVHVKNAVIMHGGSPAPLPSPPVPALPGTREKLDAMARRAQEGRSVFDPRDGREKGGAA